MRGKRAHERSIGVACNGTNVDEAFVLAEGQLEGLLGGIVFGNHGLVFLGVQSILGVVVKNDGTTGIDREHGLVAHSTKNALNTKENKTTVAEYDTAKKTFKLTFSKNKGFINVRTIASHANASFMGTLSSHGIALPLKSFRTESQVDKNVLTFSVAALVAQQKAAKKK